MLTVYILPAAWGLPSVSPFCVKLLTWLRMARIEHEVAVGDLRKAPRGKVPWVDLDGEIFSDSELIIEALRERFPVRLDHGLEADQVARGHLIRRTLEEHTYFALVWDRWMDEERWREHLEPEVRKLVPPLLAWLLPGVIRGTVRKQLHQQGMGRHDRATIMAKALADLDAVEVLLGTSTWIAGPQPSSFDAVAYGVLGSIAFGPCSPELKARVNQSRLGLYCQRMRDEVWSGEDQPTAAGRPVES